MKKALPVALGALALASTVTYVGSSLLSPSSLSDCRVGYGTRPDGLEYVFCAADVDQSIADHVLAYDLNSTPLNGYDAMFIGKRSPASRGVDYKEALTRGGLLLPDFAAGNAVLLVTPETERKLQDQTFRNRFHTVFSKDLPLTVLHDQKEIDALRNQTGFPVHRYLDTMPLRYD